VTRAPVLLSVVGSQQAARGGGLRLGSRKAPVGAPVLMKTCESINVRAVQSLIDHGNPCARNRLRDPDRSFAVVLPTRLRGCGAECFWGAGLFGREPGVTVQGERQRRGRPFSKEGRDVTRAPVLLSSVAISWTMPIGR